jgi:hypothetical protein
MELSNNHRTMLIEESGIAENIIENRGCTVESRPEEAWAL